MTTEVISLSEQDIIACTTRSLRTVVDLDFMIFSIDRFLNVGLIEALSIDNKVIFIFLDADFRVFVEELILLVCVKTEIVCISRGSMVLPILLNSIMSLTASICCTFPIAP